VTPYPLLGAAKPRGGLGEGNDISINLNPLTQALLLVRGGSATESAPKGRRLTQCASEECPCARFPNSSSPTTLASQRPCACLARKPSQRNSRSAKPYNVFSASSGRRPIDQISDSSSAIWPHLPAARTSFQRNTCGCWQAAHGRLLYNPHRATATELAMDFQVPVPTESLTGRTMLPFSEQEGGFDLDRAKTGTDRTCSVALCQVAENADPRRPRVVLPAPVPSPHNCALLRTVGRRAHPQRRRAIRARPP